ncbi:MAG: amidohydrolase [Candidatus Cloacimonadales bacterium]
MKKLFYNAKIYTMRQEEEYFSAMLVAGEKIEKLFTTIPHYLKAEKIDLQGAFVYPGFIDTHTHSFEGGLYSLGANLQDVKNLDELFEILRATQPVSNRIFAYHFDENAIEEKRFPTAEELDAIFPDTPIILRRVDGHSCVINTIAAESIAWETPLPHPFTGHLNRRWNDTAANWFHQNLSDEGILQAYQNAAEIGIKYGHTGIHTMIGDGRKDPEHYVLIRDNLQNFPLDFVLYPQIFDVPVAVKLGASRIGGCVIADGSFGSHTAALKEPYFDQPSTQGELYHDDAFWEKMITEAHENNLQACVHCIGDAAIEQILSIYEKVEKAKPKKLKHQIIHNELTSDQMLDRMAKAGVSVAMQPMFDRLWAGQDGLYEKVLGKERTSKTNRLQSIYQRGILLAGGSDWYITDLDALQGIDAATRIHNPQERLSRYQAIEIYTKNAAKICGEEAFYGSLENGKRANFVCLQEDLFTTQSIKDVVIKRVYVRGARRDKNV